MVRSIQIEQLKRVEEKECQKRRKEVNKKKKKKTIVN